MKFVTKQNPSQIRQLGTLGAEIVALQVPNWLPGPGPIQHNLGKSKNTR